jgi:hypothetical protein
MNAPTKRDRPSGPRPAKGHMPFEGHRTQEEVREHEEWLETLRQVRCR